ncbi:hypothetical protein WKW80_33025 [Variovorax humicola]|uniref:Uncharacterized protein n=1 Tax=Variovorax humicola TaxID=1769758 RepID=A0ABU8WA08_9BURK
MEKDSASAIDEAVKRVVDVYGYDGAASKTIEELVRDSMSLLDDTAEVESDIESILMLNVWWTLEVSGDSPFEEEGFPQSPLILATHLNGWYGFQLSMRFGAPRGKVIWYVDVIEGSVYAAHCDAHRQPERFVERPVFSSLEAFRRAESDFSAVGRALLDRQEGVIEEAELARIVDRFKAENKALVSAFPDHFAKRGIVGAPEPSPPTAPQVRAIANMAACTELAERLVASGLGKSKKPMALLDLDERDAPRLHANMLGLVELGRAADAHTLAERVKAEALGVPLTRRWADRVLAGKVGPLG